MCQWNMIICCTRWLRNTVKQRQTQKVIFRVSSEYTMLLLACEYAKTRHAKSVVWRKFKAWMSWIEVRISSFRLRLTFCGITLNISQGSVFLLLKWFLFSFRLALSGKFEQSVGKSAFVTATVFGVFYASADDLTLLV